MPEFRIAIVFIHRLGDISQVFFHFGNVIANTKDKKQNLLFLKSKMKTIFKGGKEKLKECPCKSIFSVLLVNQLANEIFYDFFLEFSIMANIFNNIARFLPYYIFI